MSKSLKMVTFVTSETAADQVEKLSDVERMEGQSFSVVSGVSADGETVIVVFSTMDETAIIFPSRHELSS